MELTICYKMDMTICYKMELTRLLTYFKINNRIGKNKMKRSRKFARFKDFLDKNKNRLIAGASVIFLALITIYISYAYYQQTLEEKPIIGGQVGDIPDIEVRIMVQQRDGNGNAITGKYETYHYIPKAGYEYNEELSKCSNGTIQYNNETFDANVETEGNDLCYLYFDSTAQLDISLDVYLQDINPQTGEGITDKYTKIDTITIPSIGYSLNSDKSKCDNEGTVTYDEKENKVSVEATKRNTRCSAYMDVKDVDVLVRLHLEKYKGAGEYYEAKTIPNNITYKLHENDKTQCTNSGNVTYENQELTITSVNKTVCDVYLDIDTAPINSEVNLTLSDGNTMVSFEESLLGTNVEKWHYSVDGENYEETTEDFVTIPGIVDNVYVYGEDASGNTSKVVEASDYVYNGFFGYSQEVQTKVIEKTGFYKLEVWGAQGGSYNKEIALGGLGGYATGIVKLNAGDTIFIHTGGAGTYNSSLTDIALGGNNGGGNAGYRGGTGGGATDIRLNEDSLYARVIVAGGGGGAYAYNSTFKADGGYAGGFNGASGNGESGLAGRGGTLTSGGLGGINLDALYNGESGNFGLGGSTLGTSDNEYYSSGAGGGGFYGGGASANGSLFDYKKGASGGGGSSYVYTQDTAKYYPEGCLLNENYYLINAQTLAGNQTFIDPYEKEETGHSGSGYAKITYLGENYDM